MDRLTQPGLPTAPGTYVIILESFVRRCLQIGALGTFELTRGFYTYVGSAHGPGGLAARIAHHQRQARAPHWHIDYLRPHTVFREVWLVGATSEWEHLCASALGSDPAARIPLARFGATDCRCAAHLFWFSSLPRRSALRRRLLLAAASGAAPTPAEVMRWLPPKSALLPTGHRRRLGAC